MTGGSLTVSWAPGEPIRMRGSATHVFEGELDLEALQMSVETITLGCRLNFAESETIARPHRATRTGSSSTAAR